MYTREFAHKLLVLEATFDGDFKAIGSNLSMEEVTIGDAIEVYQEQEEYK